jgi:hypothetical protein
MRILIKLWEEQIQGKPSFIPQDYWFFLTFPSSGILQTRKHDVWETGSVSVLR